MNIKLIISDIDGTILDSKHQVDTKLIELMPALKEQRIPFEIGNPRPKQELLSAIKEAEEMEKNPEIGKRYSSVKEMIKDILENEE